MLIFKIKERMWLFIQLLLIFSLFSCSGSELKKEFFALYPDGKYQEFFFSLSSSDQLKLAQKIENHDDGKVILLAANFYLWNKRLDDAVPLIAMLYVTGKNKTDFNGPMRYGSVHAFSPEYKNKFKQHLITYLKDHLHTYSKRELLRLKEVFTDNDELIELINKNFSKET